MRRSAGASRCRRQAAPTAQPDADVTSTSDLFSAMFIMVGGRPGVIHARCRARMASSLGGIEAGRQRDATESLALPAVPAALFQYRIKLARAGSGGQAGFARPLGPRLTVDRAASADRAASPSPTVRRDAVVAMHHRARRRARRRLIRPLLRRQARRAVQRANISTAAITVNTTTSVMNRLIITRAGAVERSGARASDTTPRAKPTASGQGHLHLIARCQNEAGFRPQFGQVPSRSSYST